MSARRRNVGVEEPAPRRNVELKAADPDPGRMLDAALALGADDRGVLRQRDTYFHVPAGRLKLREEEPGGATLIQYVRPDGAAPRDSRYRLVPVADPDVLRAALDGALGTLAVVEKERRLLVLDGVRIHLDRVAGQGAFVELEDVEGDEARVDEVAGALGIAAESVLSGSYADGEGVLLAAARAVMQRAYAPYSGSRVGAALRAEDGSIHVGANVENSAYPQAQCAEASALGALVAAGRRRVTEAAVVSDGPEVCVPCGGCRQRLSELMEPSATVHLLGGGAHERATLAELLPRAFGPGQLPGARPG